MTQDHAFETHNGVQISTTFSMPLGFPSIEGLTFKERKALGVAIGRFQKPSQTLENSYGKVLKVRGFIQHLATVTAIDTGEIRDVTRTVFLLESGDCVSSTSMAVDRFVKQLVAFFGAPELGIWEESISVSVLPQKTRAGQTTYSLSIVED